HEWWAGFVRLGFLLLAAVLSAAFFLLVPRRETWITGFGQATMYIYLLHSFILYPLRETGVLQDEAGTPLFLVAIVLAAIGISIALTAPGIRWLFRPLIEPKPRWLFIRLAKEPVGPSKTDPTGSRRR
ncbi:MAG: fucose 4-O-acetylase, partial [Microbacteriaceae bacterium]|nr:fucose 4-O-acetylase [Microbacteriaceae bacterium]